MSTLSLREAMRQVLAVMLAALLVPAAQFSAVYAQQPPPATYIPLNAEQLDQLVAPIALDPDSLVAQVLTGATFPDQVAAAQTWSVANISMPVDQRAAAVNNMAWDPAVKGLTEFPAVLENMSKNTSWTTQLGNAYYNQ